MYFSCFLSSKASGIWRTGGLNQDTLLSCEVFRYYSKIQEHFETLKVFWSDSFCLSKCCKMTVMFMLWSQRTEQGHQCGMSGNDTPTTEAPPITHPRPFFLCKMLVRSIIQNTSINQQIQSKFNMVLESVMYLIFMFLFILYGKAYIFIMLLKYSTEINPKLHLKFEQFICLWGLHNHSYNPLW